MTDPNDAVDFDNVTYSDSPDATFNSPAILISPIIKEDALRRVSATNQAFAPSHSVQGDAESAYATNSQQSTSHHLSASYEQGQSFVTASNTEAAVDRPLGSTDAHPAANNKLTFASLGSQPWPFPSGPYLSFAPRPIYEPTGELLHENIGTFDQFDSPDIITRASLALPTQGSYPQNSKSASVSGDTSQGSADAVDVFVQPKAPRSALKRKSESVESPIAQSGPPKKPAVQRSVSFERMSGRGPLSPNDAERQQNHGSGSGQRGRGRQPSGSTPRGPANVQTTHSATSARANMGTRAPSGHPPSILPPEKVFPIQIGSDLFRLSGASISSDAPSYFTQFFEEQIRQNEESGGVRTLYIDRDPNTFRDVARHLQGYYVKPQDGTHFVKLFADAQFYSLPRLIEQLFESEIFIQIGEKHFQIPKDIFSEPGNSPNFFSLGFAVFFSTPGEMFPGLDRRGLLRPPSITPPYVPGRSAKIFAELLHLLRGYPLDIRNESHRAELLRDCRYFHLRGLEQKVIAHDISYNLEREKQEICLRLEDVKPSGISFTPDEDATESNPSGGWVYYARPFIDDTSYEMVVEIGGECTIVDLDDMRADFHNLTKARVSSLFQVVANKMNLPTNAPLGLMMLSGGQGSQSASPANTPLSEDRVKVRFETATDITLDGKSFEIDWNSPQGQLLLEGPPNAPDESESESDAMSEDLPLPSMTQQRRAEPRQSVQGQHSLHPASTPLSVQTGRLASSAPLSRRRKGPTCSGKLGEWVIRTGQWRLRVQPNPQDSIRGGFETVFIAVKIDAFSSEKARNMRKAFLG